MEWHVAIYLRLSIEDGDKVVSNSIENQKMQLVDYIKKEKNCKVYNTYVDDGYSGTNFDRPAFQQMINDIEKGKVNTVIVKDLSRLGRNYIEMGEYLEMYFPIKKIRFIAVNDAIDSYNDPKSLESVIVPFKNLMNDQYARDISNKIKSTLRMKKIKGEFTGAFAPYGFIRSEKNAHNFEIDKEAAYVVRKIYGLALEGVGISSIVNYLNEMKIDTPQTYKEKQGIRKCSKNTKSKQWTRHNVSSILSNRSYIGDLIQGKHRKLSYRNKTMIKNNKEDWIIVKDHHKQIISKTDFERVQELLSNNKNRNSKMSDVTSQLFYGIIKCADCGGVMTVVKSKSYSYYYCRNGLRYKTCTNHNISIDKLKDIVLESINFQINILLEKISEKNKVYYSDEIDIDLEIINNKIENLNKDIKNYSLFLNSLEGDLRDKILGYEEYVEYKNDYTFMLNQCEQQIYGLLEKREKCRKKSIIEWVDIFEKFDKLKTLTRKTLIDLVKEIKIHEDNSITIVFNYQDEYEYLMNKVNTTSFCD